MKKAKKALLLVLCAALLVSASVMGTVAYLTAEDSVENTFTVGNVAIKLDETKVDKDGKAVTPSERTEDGNQGVKMIPGRTITKDPTVWIKEGSEPSYIRMKVTISKFKELKEVFGDTFLPQDYVTDWNSEVWVSTTVVNEDSATNTATYEFRYRDIVTVNADNGDATEDYTNLIPLFKTFTLPGEKVDNKDLAKLDKLSINVVAEAIQAEGFADANAAWTAFDGQKAAS